MRFTLESLSETKNNEKIVKTKRDDIIYHHYVLETL